MVRIFGSKIKVFGRDPHREVLRGVQTLIERYNSVAPENEDFFWEFYGPARVEGWLEDCALLPVLENKYESRSHATLVEEARAITDSLSKEQGQSDRSINENILRCLVFSNVVSYDVQVGIGSFEDMWRAYHLTVRSFELAPLIWQRLPTARRT